MVKGVGIKTSRRIRLSLTDRKLRSIEGSEESLENLTQIQGIVFRESPKEE